MTDQLEEIKKGFVENTLSELSSLRNELSVEDPDDTGKNGEMAQKVFMTMHGICGTAPFFGFDHLVPVSRNMERVFDGIRKGENEFTEHIKVQTIREIGGIIDELERHC